MGARARTITIAFECRVFNQKRIAQTALAQDSVFVVVEIAVADRKISAFVADSRTIFVGDLRAVDARRILSETGRTQAAPSPEKLSLLARELGAGIVISGSLVRVGSQVRADVVVATVDTEAPMVQVSATGAPQDLAAFTD